MIIKFKTNIHELAAAERIPQVETAVRNRIERMMPDLLAWLHVDGASGRVSMALDADRIMAEIGTAVGQTLYLPADQIVCERGVGGWISMSEATPPEAGYYFVWVPIWDGYGNDGHADICFWNDKSQSFEDGHFPSVEDGAPVSHWRLILEP